MIYVEKIVMLGWVRTSVGDSGGALTDLPVHELGADVASAALQVG